MSSFITPIINIIIINFIDGSIWGYNTNGDRVMIIDSNGNIVPNNYNSVLNNYRQNYGWTAGEKLFEAGLTHEMTHHNQAKTEGFGPSR